MTQHLHLPKLTGRAVWALAVVVLTVVVGWAPPAAAHDELVSSDPPASGVVESLPSRAVLRFSSQVTEVHQIAVTGPDGNVVNGEPTLAGGEVRQNLWSGPDGGYVMTYEIVSADGHEIEGEVHFEVGSLSAPSDGGRETAAEPATGWWEQGGDVIVPAALVLLAGAAAFVLSRRRR